MTKRDESYRDQVLKFMADRFDPAEKLAEKLDEQLHAKEGDRPLWNIQQRASAELATILGAEAPKNQRLSHEFDYMTSEELLRAVEEAIEDDDEYQQSETAKPCDTESS